MKRTTAVSKARVASLIKVPGWKTWAIITDLRGNPAANKARYLEMARRGELRPGVRTRDGQKLRDYIYPSSDGFDEDFTNQLKAVNPSWFEFNRDPSRKKRQLLCIAKSGKSRPPRSSSLGIALKQYTTSGSRSYDSTFDAEILRLRPDWFRLSDGRETLLAMASRGDPKPAYRSRLGGLLRSCRDKSFIAQLRKLNPTWFVTQYDRCSAAKRDVLALAAGGAAKPMRGSKY